MEIKYLDPSKLKPFEKNPKIHPDSQIKKLQASMEEFGFTNPILAIKHKKDNLVIAGHARLKASIEQGLRDVPVIFLGLPYEKAIAYNVADNRLSELAQTDDAMLLSLLDDIEMSGVDVELTGYDFKEINLMRDKTLKAEETPVPPLPKEAKAKTGEIYKLGSHRLMCGDSTKTEDVEALMDGVKADMVFTDPPYNCDYGSSKKEYKHEKVTGDKQTKGEWNEFNKSFIENIKNNNSGDVYIWAGPGPDGMRQRLQLVDAGYHWSATIIWKKDQLILTPAKYQRIYEPCFYGWHDKSSYKGDRKQVELWEIDRPKNSKEHPTMKPLELCSRAIKNSSLQGNSVLDLFGGSGQTLLACEQLQRKCYMMELDPRYVDVIIKRWEDYTGKKAEKLNGRKA